MIKLVYFDFDFWRVDILRLCLAYSNIPYIYERIPREEWANKKKDFPFGQLPVMILNGKKFAHTHSIAKFCAIKANLYGKNEIESLVIDQVIDWANEITIKIAPSIRAAMRENNPEKSKKLRKLFIKNDLLVWYSYLEELFNNFSSKKKFFTDRLTIADITAWRIIYWFCSKKLDHVDPSFLKEFPSIYNFFNHISAYRTFTNLKEFKSITN